MPCGKDGLCMASHVSSRHSGDELPYLARRELGEPEGASRTHRETPGAAARMREGILGDLVSLRIDLANPVPVELGEPQVATRTCGDAPGAAAMRQWEQGELA